MVSPDEDTHDVTKNSACIQNLALHPDINETQAQECAFIHPKSTQ